jgi:parallel beta-helix repeat protein
MITIKKLFVTVALTALQQYAYAANYYVDSELGNDSWSGKLPTAISSPLLDGPWQSLNRLATATLSPGDVVELKCGSKWIQTLRLKNSGTLERPIVIRSGSSTCSVPPSIDGSQTIDAHNWVRHNNAIYKASWPIQKFQNGTLAMGIAGWTSWSASADQKLLYESSCPDSSSGCAAFTSSAKPGSIAISNDFLMEGGVTYSGELSLRIPAGVKVKILVRRGSSPYEAISAVQWITGTSAWQKISFAFLPRTTVPNARLDIEVPDAGVKVHFKNASLTPTFANPLGAWIDDLPLLPAYHPNRGHDITRPNSVYARAAADGNAVRNNIGGTGSNYLDIDSTLKLPAGTSLKPGNRLRIRSAPWNIDEVTVTKIEGNRLYFDPATRYQVRTGQGYFVLGELGMLDSPGEWIYDANTGSTYVWTSDSIPSDHIRLSTLDIGIDLSNRSNIIIEGINVLYTGMGIDLTSAQNITLRSMRIANTIRNGILATSAKNISIVSNRIQQTGGDAISAKGAMTLNAEENDISNSAVTVISNRIWSLPGSSYAAIFTGAYARIKGNRINNSASNGIWTLADGIIANGIIESNAVLNSCLQINDCGGIYVNYSSPNTRIASNLIERVSGNVDGLDSNVRTHAIGIYLDDHSNNMEIENNIVAWADYGIQVHNAYSNRINMNLLHGNRNGQIWFQERTNQLVSTGDVFDNKISNNRFFPTTSTAAVMIESEIGSLTDFGVLAENRYSTLFSKRVVSESWPSHNLAYTLPEWESISNRRLLQDVGSSQLAQEGYATYLAAGGNIVPNGGLKNGMGGWSSWNATAPLATRMYESCSLGPCLRVTAGGSATLLSTPNFSVESGRAYRVTFDAKTSTDGQFIAPLVRRGGPTPLYELLMPASEGFSGSMEWRRYTFVFTAAKTVNAGDSVTGDLGARIDFENILPGQALWVTNVEVIPLQTIENTLRTQLITNPDRTTQSRDCPDRETAAEYCDRYHVFPEGTLVSWPVDLPPLSAVSMYTINPATLDNDGDGIADSGDLCPNTLKTDQVNASGCAITQIPTK